MIMIEEAAWWMLQELESQHLEVICDGNLRIVVSENPKWYQQLCVCYMKSRKRYPKLRTYIKRCHVMRTLKDIAYGKNPMTVYASRLESIIENYRHSC